MKSEKAEIHAYTHGCVHIRRTALFLSDTIMLYWLLIYLPFFIANDVMIVENDLLCAEYGAEPSMAMLLLPPE